MPMLNLRLAYPDHLVDLNGIEGLAYICEEGEELSIGAMTSQRTIEFSDVIKRRVPLMAEAILSVGHRQTRNRGTIGGSLCHLDPSAELPLVAAALDATVVVSSVGNVRLIAMADFGAGFMTPSIEADEIVTELRLKPWAQGHGWAFTEYSRRKGDFAVVAAAALLEFSRDRRIARAALALGGVAATPVRMRAAEQMLLGRAASPDLFKRVAALCADIDSLEDPHIPSWYRQRLACVLAQRVLETASRRAQ